MYMITTPTRSHYWDGKDWTTTLVNAQRFKTEKAAKVALEKVKKDFASAKVVQI